jgi:hypothetical protein
VTVHRAQDSILLAGTPRCGSTWLANVLSRAEHTRPVYEPDGPISDVLGAMVATRLGAWPALRPQTPSRWYKLVWDLAFSGGWPWDRVEGARAAGRQLVRVPPAARDLAIGGLAVGTARLRRAPERVLVKSVNSAFSLEWIAQRYGPKVVVLHRNPLNVISSWLVLDMFTKEAIGHDPVIRADYLDPLGLTPPPAGSDPLVVASWNVGLLMLGLKRTSARHPSWTVASYDSLSVDPLTSCQDLFSALDLRWTEEAAQFLREADDPGFVVHGGTARAHPNAVTATEGTSRRSQQGSQYRRRMSDEDIRRAREIVDRFDLGDWAPNED